MSIIVVGDSSKIFRPEATRRPRTPFLVDRRHDGDNIDFFNPYFCELTGLYYMWKHDDGDIVGLEHYRRYLSADGRNPIGEPEIIRRLSKADAICSVVNYGSRPIKSYFQARGDEFYGWMLKYISWLSVVDKDYGNRCLRYMSGNRHVLGNIFISRRELLDEYAQFLFGTLIPFHDCEVRLGRRPYPRIFGYLSEFLFGCWLESHGKRIDCTGICWG